MPGIWTMEGGNSSLSPWKQIRHAMIGHWHRTCTTRRAASAVHQHISRDPMPLPTSPMMAA